MTWHSGEGSNAYFALKAGAVGVEASGAIVALTPMAAKVAVRIGALKLAATLCAVPEPSTTAVGILIGIGIGLHVAADKVLHAEREGREKIFEHLTADERFNLRLMELHNRSDVLRAGLDSLMPRSR